jgi:hypothetical protein
MSSGKGRPHEPARSRIDLNLMNRLRYWLRELDVSEAELRAAIALVGNAAADVRRHFHGDRGVQRPGRLL